MGERISAINEIREEIINSEFPHNVKIELNVFIARMMRQKQITLYEAYLIKYEALRYSRMSYLKYGYRETVGISDCLSIMNEKHMAVYFSEIKTADILTEWALEAYLLNGEKRSHYIMNNFTDYLSGSPDYLEKLAAVRESDLINNFDNGPYHNECFPYGFSYERALLNKSQMIEKVISPEVEDLLVELMVLDL